MLSPPLRHTLQLILLTGLLGLPASVVRAASLEDSLLIPDGAGFRTSAREVLERAFDNLYECDLLQKVEMVTRTRSGEARRQRVNRLRKRIDGRAHSLLEIRTTNEQWGLRVLRIERKHRDDDRFVWVPNLRRVRRLSSAQRGDQVEGTDLNLEDLEFRRAETFEIVGRSFTTLGDERVHLLTLQPLFASGYARMHMYVAMNDFSIREVHYYRRSAKQPYKVQRSPVADLKKVGGHVMPGRWIITDFDRGSETDVIFSETAVDPDIGDHLFSSAVLENGRPLPGVEY